MFFALYIDVVIITQKGMLYDGLPFQANVILNSSQYKTNLLEPCLEVNQSHHLYSLVYYVTLTVPCGNLNVNNLSIANIIIMTSYAPISSKIELSVMTKPRDYPGGVSNLIIM